MNYGQCTNISTDTLYPTGQIQYLSWLTGFGVLLGNINKDVITMKNIRIAKNHNILICFLKNDFPERCHKTWKMII